VNRGTGLEETVSLDEERVPATEAGGHMAAWERNPGRVTQDPVQSAFVMAVQLLEAGRASLLLRQDADPVLTMAAAVGIKPSLVETIQIPYGAGVAGLVAEKGLSLLGRSLSNETFVCAPIVTQSGIEGVLNVTDRIGGRQFSGADLASTSFVAAHIANLLEFRRQSMVDFVSGLPNRTAFEEALERELARSARTNRQFSMVYIDVDRLKEVNDRAGHAAGDELLRNVATALKRAIRQYDFVARIGGDEFGVLLADSHEGEVSFARRLSARTANMDEPFSLSLGVARFPEDGRTAPDLMRVADGRMYEYKRTYGLRGVGSGRPAEAAR